MTKLIESARSLGEVLRSEPECFILFYATWCPFSMSFLPVYETYAKDDRWQFYRLATDELEEVEEAYSVDVVPTVLFFRKGQVARRLDGAQGWGLSDEDMVELLDAVAEEARKGGVHG